MNRVCLFIIALSCLFSYSQGFDYSNYPGATGPAYSGSGKAGPGVSCPDAINNANRAFDQLVRDLRNQAPQWSVYSDFDAANEVSYFLKNSCKTENLQLVRVGPTSPVATEEQACNELLVILEDILEENNAADWRGGFESGIDTAQKGLALGKDLGNNCKFRLIEQEDNGSADPNATESDANNAESDNPGPVKRQTSLRVGASQSTGDVGGEEEDLWNDEEVLEPFGDVSLYAYDSYGKYFR